MTEDKTTLWCLVIKFSMSLMKKKVKGMDLCYFQSLQKILKAKQEKILAALSVINISF